MNKQTQNKLLELVKKNYQEIAPHYNETRKKNLGAVWQFLIELIKDVPDNARVLDIGCGNGRLLEAFGNKQIRYLGIDPCVELIEKAKEQKPGYRFEIMDWLKLDKLSESNFDYIISVAVFHHLPSQELRLQALKQMKDKLKPDGQIIITAWNLWSQLRFRKLLFKFAFKKLIGQNRMDMGDILFPWKNSSGQVISERYYHAFTIRELKNLSRKAGLKMDKMFKDNYNYFLALTKYQ